MTRRPNEGVDPGAGGTLGRPRSNHIAQDRREPGNGQRGCVLELRITSWLRTISSIGVKCAVAPLATTIRGARAPRGKGDPQLAVAAVIRDSVAMKVAAERTVGIFLSKECRDSRFNVESGRSPAFWVNGDRAAAATAIAGKDVSGSRSRELRRSNAVHRWIFTGAPSGPVGQWFRGDDRPEFPAT